MMIVTLVTKRCVGCVRTAVDKEKIYMRLNKQMI
ncbi:hypothetical protein JAB6_40140 [Janthinobacterium sp. HH104]|nr:hypothetical protein JAB6_40140 [Janthinobacterium sp. HH104]